MPQLAPSVLLVSVADVLDRSKAGREGARALEARFAAARARHSELKDITEAARFEEQAVRDLELERARLRDDLLARARAVCAALRQERGAAVVMDRDIALAHADGIDVTDEVIARLDRA